MGVEYLSLDELSKEKLKSEDSRATVCKALFTDDNSVNFVTRIGISLRSNDYYINKFSGLFIDTKSKSKKEDEGKIESIYDEDDYDDGEEALEDLMNEWIDFGSEDEIEEEEKEKEKKEEECDAVLQGFKDTVKNTKCTTAVGMEKILKSIENNLNHAITILNSKNDDGKKDKIKVKSSDIKGLLSQFKIIKATEWERPTKHIPKDTENAYVGAQRAIFRTKFFNAYEQVVKEFLDKFPDNPQGKEAEIVKILLLTLRPTKAPDRDETNTGDYAYKELISYATTAEEGYDEEYDTRSSGGVKIEADFEFTHDEDSNTILHRLLAILLERAECESGTLGSYVNKVFTGKYEFNYSTEPIWDYQKAKFEEEKIGKVEEAFEGIDDKTPIKEAYKAFYTAVYGKEGLSANKKTSLGREKTKTLIETFVDTKVAHYQDVLTFLGLPTINKNDAKYKKLFQKLTLNIEETPK